MILRSNAKRQGPKLVIFVISLKPAKLKYNMNTTWCKLNAVHQSTQLMLTLKKQLRHQDSNNWNLKMFTLFSPVIGAIWSVLYISLMFMPFALPLCNKNALTISHTYVQLHICGVHMYFSQSVITYIFARCDPDWSYAAS